MSESLVTIQRDVNEGFTNCGRLSLRSIVTHMNQQRLTAYRTYRKLTTRKLAELSKIPLRLVKAFESGEDSPDSEQYLALADALNVDVGRLLDPRAIRFREFQMRGKSELSHDQMLAVGIDMAEHLQDHLDLRQILGLPPTSWVAPQGDPIPVHTLPEAESAAEIVRSAWGLADRPIYNFALMLEEHGVIVVEHAFEEHEAFVATVEHGGSGRLYGIGTKSGPWSLRRRFSLAHELGHICMACGKDRPPGFDSELAADRFAGAFLLPARVLEAALQEGSVAEVLDLRARYGVSAQSIARRCVQLGLRKSAWMSDVIEKTRARHQDAAVSGWDGPTDAFERRCQEAHERGLMSRSRARELIDRSSRRVGADAA